MNQANWQLWVFLFRIAIETFSEYEEENASLQSERKSKLKLTERSS